METKDQSEASKQEEVKPAEESSQQQEGYVARKAYEEVTSDMHKFKQRAKDANARINELEARLKAEEEAKLKEQENWQQLYEREKAEREEAERIRSQERNQYLKAVKLSALKSELGGTVKDEYLQFADVESIELGEDGTLSSESVRHVANKFRHEHPSLVVRKDEANITNRSAAGDISYSEQEKTIEQMSVDEKKQKLYELYAQKNRS